MCTNPLPVSLGSPIRVEWTCSGIQGTNANIPLVRNVQLLELPCLRDLLPTVHRRPYHFFQRLSLASTSLALLPSRIPNSATSQLRRPLNPPLRSTLAYLFRFAVCILTMEFILHFMYVVAIKDTKAWQGTNAAELSMIGFWNLIIVWLKVNSIFVSPHMRL